MQTFIERILDRSLRPNSSNSLETIAQAHLVAGRIELAEPDHAEGDHAGRAGFLSGHGILGFFVGRSRQPPAGRFCRAAHPLLASIETPDWLRLAAGLAERPFETRLDPPSPQAANRNGRCLHRGRLSAAAGDGPHREHVIAFARRHGRDAAIVAVAKSFAPFTDGGRSWPRAEAFEGAIDISGYSVKDGSGTLPLSELFRHLPAAVLRRKCSALQDRLESAERSGSRNAAAVRDRTGRTAWR